MRAHLAGGPFDATAVGRFDVLRDDLACLAHALRGATPIGELPFPEENFSNFIEGTESNVTDATPLGYGRQRRIGQRSTVNGHDERLTGLDSAYDGARVVPQIADTDVVAHETTIARHAMCATGGPRAVQPSQQKLTLVGVSDRPT
jgi:hypothetical protein